MPKARDSVRPRPATDGGFTVVEVLIAAVLLAITAIAVFGLVDAASRNNYRSQQSQVVNDRLQQEMEKLKQVPYDQLALTSVPAHSSVSSDPNSRVSGTTFNVSPSGSNYEGLVYNGGNSQESGGTVSGGTVDPGPTSFQDGDVKGSIYRYVTWEHDDACGNCGQDWYKHVVVAVALDPTASGSTRRLPGASGEPLQSERRPQQVPCWVERLHQPGRAGPDPVDVLAHRHAVQLQRPPADHRRPPEPRHLGPVRGRAEDRPAGAPGHQRRCPRPDVHPGGCLHEQRLHAPGPALRLRHRRRAAAGCRPRPWPADGDAHRQRLPPQHRGAAQPAQQPPRAAGHRDQPPARGPQVALARRSRPASTTSSSTGPGSSTCGRRRSTAASTGARSARGSSSAPPPGSTCRRSTWT